MFDDPRIARQEHDDDLAYLESLEDERISDRPTE